MRSQRKLPYFTDVFSQLLKVSSKLTRIPYTLSARLRLTVSWNTWNSLHGTSLKAGRELCCIDKFNCGIFFYYYAWIHQNICRADSSFERTSEDTQCQDMGALVHTITYTDICIYLYIYICVIHAPAYTPYSHSHQHQSRCLRGPKQSLSSRETISIIVT